MSHRIPSFQKKRAFAVCPVPRLLKSFFLMALLFNVMTASPCRANYWTIDYAPFSVGVVRGDLEDDIASVLRAVSCPYEIVDPAYLWDLSAMPDIKVLFVEGSGTFLSGSQIGDGEKVAGIVKFVKDGGRVFITGRADFLVNSLGAGLGVETYKPWRPGEMFTNASGVPPFPVKMKTYGALKTHLALTEINVMFPWNYSKHSALALGSIACPGGTPELTADYVTEWIENHGSYVDWEFGLTSVATSLIFPLGNNGGRVHYVNYPLASAYCDSGEVGEALAKYQIGNILAGALLVSDDIFGIGKAVPGAEVDKGTVRQAGNSGYVYAPGRGALALSLGGDSAASLKIENVDAVERLIVKKIGDDLVLSVKGTTGSIAITDWFVGGGRLSSFELGDGSFVTGERMQSLAVASEPDVDVTPISYDRRIVPQAGQVEIDGTDGGDYIFGNPANNVMRGGGGSNIYYYRTGDGHDTIINTKEPGARNALRFHTDITSADVTASRVEDDMRFTVPGGSVTVKGWYADAAAKLDLIEIYGGTRWDARDVERMAAGKAPLPREYVVNPEPVEYVRFGGQDEDAAETQGCDTSAGGWLPALTLALAALRKKGARAMRIISAILTVAFLIAFSAGGADAAQKKRSFTPPSVSLQTPKSGDARRGQAVVITPGYAYIGAFTSEEFRIGHTEIWGVDSKIENYKLWLTNVYVPDADRRYVKEINPVVTLPQNIDLIAGKQKLADVVFAADEDLEPGKYKARIMCDLILPSELGGGERDAFVEYEFDIIASDVKIAALGGLIGTEGENGFEDRNLKQITEQYLANVELTGETIRKGFAADGLARLIIRLQSDAPATVRVNIPEFYTLGINAESLERKPLDITDLTNLTLEQVEGRDNLYQASFAIKAPESWPFVYAIAPLDFSVIVAPEDNFREPVALDLQLHNTPVVMVHGIWASADSFYNPDEGGESLAKTLEEANIIRWSESYDNWRGPSEIVPPGSSFFYNTFFEPLYEIMAKESIECARFDVVGHSMGGLMAKRFTLNDYYKTENSYGQGSIRRLVTLGTPHWGSPFPSYLRKDTRYLGEDYFIDTRLLSLETEDEYARREGLRNRAIAGHALVKFVLWLFERKVESAIDDLRVCSPIIQELNNTKYDIYMHVMAGDSGNTQIVESGLIGTGAKGLMYPYKHSLLFCDVEQRVLRSPSSFVPENSDMVVGVSSALWAGAGFSNPSYINILDGVKHTGMANHSSTRPHVLSLLKGPLSSFMIPQTPISAYYEPESRRAPAPPAGDAEGSEEAKFAPLEILILSVDKAEAKPGDTVEFSVTSDREIEDVYLLDEDLASFEMVKTGASYTCDIDIADHLSGTRKFVAIASADEGYAISGGLSIVVRPDAAKLSMLKFAEGDRLTFEEGRTFSTMVRGLFADGREYNLTEAATGTKYTTSDQSVAAVSENGVVTTRKAGECAITAANDGVGAIMYLTVKSPEGDENSTPGTTPDGPSAPSRPDSGSSGSGGCNGGYVFLVVFALLFAMKVNGKKAEE